MQLLARLPTLARELEPFFWTMCSALGLKPEYKTVPVMELETTIVPTLKMLVLNAKVIILYDLCVHILATYVVLISIILPFLNFILQMQ